MNERSHNPISYSAGVRVALSTESILKVVYIHQNPSIVGNKVVADVNQAQRDFIKTPLRCSRPDLLR